MISQLIIGGALANCGRDAPTDEFLQMLVRETTDLAAFRFQPKPRPGIGIKAALDWQAILGTGADILAFAGVLWAAYERYVKPKIGQIKGPHKPFLVINLRRQDGTFVQFSLGNEHKNKEIFIEQFSRQVTELRIVSDAEDQSTLISQISESEDWVRINCD